MREAPALETMHAIKLELVAEVARARAERQMLRSLDAEALLRRATLRQLFNDKVDRLQRVLKAQLAVALAPAAPEDATVEALARAYPHARAALTGALQEVRALASALTELDALNRSIAERTLGIVRGYMGALSPQAQAYDFRGARPAAEGSAVHSTRV